MAETFSEIERKVWALGLVALGLTALVVAWAWRVAELVWLRPRRLGRELRGRGLAGTEYKLLRGDLKDLVQANRVARSRPMGLSHAIVPRISPFYLDVIEKHGKNSFNWFGPYPRVCITDPDLVREILSNKFGHFDKPKSSPLTSLLVTGLVSYDGEKWAKHRRIINPAFHLEKLKRMLPAFSVCCDELIQRWEKLVGSSGSREVDVWPELQSFTGNVISHAAFGSSYQEGQRIFELQSEQSELFIRAAQTVYIPGLRFLPTKQNRRMKDIEREVRTLLRTIIEKREKAIRAGDAKNDDLLGLLLESSLSDFQEQKNSKNSGLTTNDVIEECKLFYFAGQETTSVLLTWTMIALSMHPEWQERARNEVLQVFGNNVPDFEDLSHLKIVTMILYEVLRLYPPATFVTRKTYKEMKLGEITIPADVQLMMLILFIHHDPEFWGADADEFRPERFREGISKASKDQVAFFPFGWGPRICMGQNFALLEAKMGLARILQNFSFELSPSYAHAPHTIVTLQPQHGAQLMLHKL